MATQILNQATLDYSYGQVNRSTASNTATVTLQGPLEVAKHSLQSMYRIGDEITYNIFVSNTSTNPLTNLTIVDDLGTYALNPTVNVTPLTVINPAKLFIDNVYQQIVRGTVSAENDAVTFTIASLPAGSKMLLQFRAEVNEYAGAILGTSVLKNTATITADGVATPMTASNELPLLSYADVVVEKEMSPDPVVDGSTLTYTFTIRNYGTVAASSMILHDTFDPAPNITSVTVDGTATTAYSDLAGVFRYPGEGSTVDYTIPAATFTQDSATGVVTITPSTSIVVIRGTI